MTNAMRSELLNTLKGLGTKECSELLDFAHFLKMRRVIDPDQAYFWTRRWQEMERRATEDKAKGRILGDGTLKGLFKALKKRPDK